MEMDNQFKILHVSLIVNKKNVIKV